MKSIKAFRTTEMIIQTTTFDPGHGQWSFIVLDGSIDIIEKDDDVYHIALHSKALVMVYRHNEHGIQFARLYFNASSVKAGHHAIK